MATRQGKQTIWISQRVSVTNWASIGSKKESEGPMSAHFDILRPDSTFEQSTWEKAESRMVTLVVQRLLEKASLTAADIDFAFAGDLLNQCVGTTFGMRSAGIPLFGLYGACSTMAEGLALAALTVDGGAANRAMALTSSHFCTAERQYRFPLEYGGVRPPTSQWTATAAGALLVERAEAPPYVRAVTVGTIEDPQVKDQNNMGAAMAPAAAATLTQFFKDTNMQPGQFDLIITGDLGLVGSRLLLELMKQQGLDVQAQHNDCGLLLYDREKQDVHAGASGCGCSAAVLCGYLLTAIRDGKLKNILFEATGALMSPTTVQQKESIPGIAHLVWLSHYPG